MYTIKTLNAISPVGLAKLPKNQFDVTVDADAPDGILVRSADLLNTTFNDNLLAIARAGAGVNNIPLERCSEQGIVVFNTPGANANAVAELVIGMLIAGSRNVAAAAQWCQGLAGDPAMSKSVEKGKKQFVGNEIKGKTLGVIGLGAIGSRVANCAIELGMEVYGYDPYISIEAAWNLSSQVHHCVNLNDMLPLCDYITIHVPYLPTTKDTINAQTLALCKDGVKILNYARGELVNTAALLEAMDSGKVSGYMLVALNGFLDFMGETQSRVKTVKVQKQMFRSTEKEMSRAEYKKLIEKAYRMGREQTALIMETIGATGIRISVALNAFCILFAITILALEFSNCSIKSLEHENEMLAQLLECDKQQYEQAKKDMEKINIRYHDLKQQYSRATDEERARLEEEMNNLNLRYFTGNKALDITLTQKSALCGQAGIQLVCSADGSCLENMKHYHIYSLLGNALDNAIECLTQVNDASKRVITLDISRCRDMAVIRVQNYTPAPPTLRDGAIVTTKQDTEEHGYGIKSIKSIAELYGGTADCFVEDSIFYLVVTFPCGKSQKETA